MSEKIKPCPFCGKQPYTEPWSSGFYKVICGNEECPAQPRVVGGSELLAVQIWNARKEQLPTKEEPKLKPCPFCGGEDIEISKTWFSSSVPGTNVEATIPDRVGVFCMSCGIGYYNKDSTMQYIIDEWNKRAG